VSLGSAVMTVDESTGLQDHARTDGLRGSVMTLVRALKESLAGVRAKELTRPGSRYMTARLEAGYARARCSSRSLTLRAFHLAHRRPAARAPYFRARDPERAQGLLRARRDPDVDRQAAGPAQRPGARYYLTATGR